MAEVGRSAVRTMYMNGCEVQVFNEGMWVWVSASCPAV